MGPLLLNQWGGFSGICAALRGGGIMKACLTIRIPVWVDRIFVWPLMFYRKCKYGYDFRRIYLGEGEWTIVDTDVYYRLGNLKWNIRGNGKKLYAVRFVKIGPGRTTLLNLHREIINAPKGIIVDHKNGCSLDNRRVNLRLATRSQNGQNVPKRRENTSSQFVGVSFDKERRKWLAYINYEGKRKWLGRFGSEIDAARVYDAAARKYFGEFARLNFSAEATVS